MATTKKTSGTSVAHNRKAGFDIDIKEKWEAGLILTGDEITCIRNGRVQLTGGYVRLLSDIPMVVGMHLSQAKEPDRVRKLLLSAKQIAEMKALIREKGFVAVPLDVHFKHGWAKLTVGIGVGRKGHDKRELLKSRDLEREMRRM